MLIKLIYIHYRLLYLKLNKQNINKATLCSFWNADPNQGWGAAALTQHTRVEVALAQLGELGGGFPGQMTPGRP
jgi:hypothetical protein